MDHAVRAFLHCVIPAGPDLHGVKCIVAAALFFRLRIEPAKMAADILLARVREDRAIGVDGGEWNAGRLVPEVRKRPEPGDVDRVGECVVHDLLPPGLKVYCK